MEKLKTSVRRFIYKVKHHWLVFDNLLLIICIVLCVAWTVGSINAMSRNWDLSEKLRERERELSIARLEVETMELENLYYASDEYAELSARAKMNKKLEGETLVYLPSNSDNAKYKHRKVSDTDPPERSNLSQWFSFLFGA